LGVHTIILTITTTAYKREREIARIGGFTIDIFSREGRLGEKGIRVGGRGNLGLGCVKGGGRHDMWTRRRKEGKWQLQHQIRPCRSGYA